MAGLSRRSLARSNSAPLDSGRGGARRVGAELRGQRPRERVVTIILLNLSCQPQTNFGRVKDEILGPTESGISPLRRA
jgi:hypothetical protein